MTLILEPDAATAASLATRVPGEHRIADPARPVADQLLASDELLVIGPSTDSDEALGLTSAALLVRPHLDVLLVRPDVDTDLLRAAMRAGLRDVVLLGSRELEDACHRSLEGALLRQTTSAAHPARPAGAQVVTVFAAKGGVGKTTIATNLAVCLAAKGTRRVCLLDLDLAFGDVAIVLQLFPAKTLGDAVALSRLDATAVQSLITRHSAGVDVIAAPVDPGTSESISAGLVANLLEVLSTSYDVVVIDTPPAFTEQVLSAFDRTDHFVLPATLDIPSVKNLKLTLETLDLLGYAPDARHVLLNRSDSKVALTIQDVEKSLQTRIALQIPSSRSVPSSINRGVPIVLDAPNHAVATALRRFADSIAPRSSVPAALQADRRLLGLLRRPVTS